MRLTRLIVQEIRYRKLNFALGTLSVVVAVGCAIGLMSALRQHQRETEQIIANRQNATAAMMKQNEEEYRKIGVAMGFNMVILDKKQSVADFYANNLASVDMDENWGKKIADVKLTSINHVTPVLQQRVHWDQYNRDIFLTGSKVAYMLGGGKIVRKPILAEIPRGQVVLGHELERVSGLKVGDNTTILGRQFTVKAFKPGGYNKDDVTAFVNLAEAQEMLNRPGRINGIFALECTNCGPEAFAVVRKEVGQALPDAQVVEFAQLAEARSDARRQAAALTKLADDQEIQHRRRMGDERRRLAAVLIPLVVVVAAVWIAFLTFTNARDRGREIGILRAIGLRSGQILGVFLAKAVLMGIVGAATGYLGAMIAGRFFHGSPIASAALLDRGWLMYSIVGAPLLAAAAACLPAMIAAFRDPAVLLRED